MGAERLKLPIGIQSFEVMRSQGFLYVDKTPHIHRLVTEGMYYFLSRPRRFVKSLLVSTLKCLFQGQRDLFDGLWIAETGRWNWQPHPVIALDMSLLPSPSAEKLEQSIAFELRNQASAADISLTAPSIEQQFQQLILGLAQRMGTPVVILIDEYDKPIINHLGRGAAELDIAKANREVLRNFFGTLKGGAIAPHLRFVLLTGVSRFSRVSIFSELNNLFDISSSGDYAELLGYTQNELETRFAPHIKALAEETGLSHEETLKKLAQHYNGYRFSKKERRVYNPFSILNALTDMAFREYWFETGTPSFLVHLLKEKRYNLSGLENTLLDSSFATFDLDNLHPISLMFQTGYLTIKDMVETAYQLDYPNQEVKHAFSNHLLAAEIPQDAQARVIRLARHLAREDFDAFFETIRALFASIPYDLESKRDEAYFHTLFYLMVASSGADARSSVLTCEGKIDLLVEFPDRVCVIEFKCNQSAETALQQIRAKRYAAPHQGSGKRIFLLGVNFSTETRNIAEWKVEQLAA